MSPANDRSTAWFHAIGAAPLLRAILAGGHLVLIAVTWPLWFGADVFASASEASPAFPMVPLFAGLVSVPPWIDFWMSTGLVVGLVVWLGAGNDQSMVCGGWGQRGLTLAVIANLSLVALNQHRLQPWNYQFLVLEVLFLLAPGWQVVTYWRWLVISIYGYSAISKLDPEFAATFGPWFWSGFTKALALGSSRLFADSTGTIVGWFLPVGELGVAALLAWRPARRWGLVASLGVHTGLLATLGPWGLAHSAGVQAWNLFFIVQNLVLWQGLALWALPQPLSKRELSPLSLEPGVAQQTSAARWARRILVFVLAWPLTHSLGYCDHWPAWAVYVPTAEKVVVDLAASEVDLLPEGLRKLVSAPDFQTDRCQLRIAKWSLSQSLAPVYPEERFILGVAAAVAAEHHLQTLVVTRSSSRGTSNAAAFGALERAERTRLFGLAAIEAYGRRYRINWRPRVHPQQSNMPNRQGTSVGERQPNAPADSRSLTD